MVKADSMAKLDGVIAETKESDVGTGDTSWDRAPARIKVIGVGGGGCNCIRRMLDSQVHGVRFAMVNTDIKSLETDSESVEVVQIGRKVTKCWDAGENSKVGEQAAEESTAHLRNVLKDSELVFITTAMGGGTGTGAAP